MARLCDCNNYRVTDHEMGAGGGGTKITARVSPHTRAVYTKEKRTYQTLTSIQE